jgi:tetratricopeptide (TPR) repeat protein
LDGTADVLAVVSVRTDVLSERGRESHLVDQLCERSEVLDLDPLGISDMRTLLAGSLDLDAGDAAQLAERTEGNPAFAVQIVRDQVERGQLLAEARGFRLVEGALPPTIGALWAGRFERAIAGQQAWRDLTEVAAALGTALTLQDWRRAAAEADLAFDEEVVDRLARRGLLHVDGGTARFAASALRELIETSATQSARWHRAIAAICPPEAMARRGRHLLRGGDPERALHALVSALEDAVARLDDAGTETTLRHAREAQRAAAVDPASHDACELDILELKVAKMRFGSIVHLEDRIRAVIAAVRGEGHVELLPDALLLLHALRADEGRFEESEALAQEAFDVARAYNAGRDAMYAALHLAHVHLIRGDLDRAETLLDEGIEAIDAANEALPLLRGQAAQFHAWAASSRGDQEGTKRWAQDCLRWARAAGAVVLEGRAYEAMAVAAHLAAQLDEAEQLYNQADAAFRRIGAERERNGVRVNLATLHADRGDFARATDMLEAEQRRAKRAGETLAADRMAIFLAQTYAGLGRWTELDQSLARVDGTGTAQGYVKALVSAAQMAWEAGQHQRAARAWGLAADQLERLGDHEGAAALRGRS